MSAQKPQIVMRSGPIPGSTYFIEKDETVLGRDLSNDIAVPDPEISRRHARFIKRPEGVYVEDLGSTNGTFVNGARIAAPQLLKNGDLITLAESTVVSFELPIVAQQAHAPMNVPAPMYDSGAQAQPTSAGPVYAPVEAPIPSAPLAPEPRFVAEKKPMGWCSIILIVLLVSLIIIALVLTFMPTSWWCLLSFDQLPGCPLR
ncbi:MAG TPA: FHA domain-containing protein [Anaerolineaceae bacterium]|nr:FHA domain-containing protein [Chloroflexota bacterium]HNY83369.1 FHA domain-containing protein [Anaerolineaceae bacterium]